VPDTLTVAVDTMYAWRENTVRPRSLPLSPFDCCGARSALLVRYRTMMTSAWAPFVRALRVAHPEGACLVVAKVAAADAFAAGAAD
jgi:hypothetical protein